MENIAIIGMGCRFPKADNPEAFWHLVSNGIDAITEVPADRWNVDELYDSQPATPGKMNTRWGGFLSQVDGFDPLFFNISPKEAKRMDPKQRLFLEVAWEALENAGLAPDKLAGTQTGVFVAPTGGSQYHQLLYKNPENLTQINAYDGIGSTPSLAASRLSYLLNLKGPSLAIETACSSSLVAIHLASQSLRTGESNLCIVGGVNLILTPELHISFSQAQMMSPDGRCKTFDADANGYVRGEGCGVVILKRLSNAVEDGDNILAVIKGSAVNQDGLSNGITAPNGLSQQAVIRQALKNAGVKPAEISYVEAHGTGTPLGDPIEMSSLKTVLMEERLSTQSCYIGSVKANIGHLELAAGMAGLIKVVLSLQNKQIAPNVNFKRLNPYIRIKNTPLTISTELEEWNIEKGSRLAGVSSFGFGGTNAHIVLEEAPTSVVATKNRERSQHLFTLSAKSESALQELAQSYNAYLESHPQISLEDVCYTANTGRSQFDARLAIVVNSTMELRKKLSLFAAGEDSAGLIGGRFSNVQSPKIAFLFTGQGSQYLGMGRQLYETQPVFRQALEQCQTILKDYLEQPLLETLYNRDLEATSFCLLNQTSYTQPALFAVEYALVQLWRSWGIEPDVVMGHSLGEYVAACVAGVFTLEEGLKLVAHRGKLMQALSANGKMVSILADEATVRGAIEPYQSIAIAAFNGPRSLVISGREDEVTTVRANLEKQGIKTKELNVSHAFHSTLMQPMLAEYEKIATQVNYKDPEIPLVSNLTGNRADENIATTQYWLSHITQPVKFAQSMQTLNEEGDFFLEIGAKPILLGMGRQCLPADAGVWLPSLRQGVEDWQQILKSLSQLYIQGVQVDWSAFDCNYVRHKVPLPTYPFQRQRYWLETTENVQAGTNSAYKLLSPKELKILGAELKKSGELSEAEIQLLPKLLELLIEQNQQKSAKISAPKNRDFKIIKGKLPCSNSVLQKSKSDEILSAEPETRKHLLRSYLGQLLAKVVGISPADLDWQRRLCELGIDSLMATQIRHHLESNLKIVAPVEYYAELDLEQFLTQILLLIEKKISKCLVETSESETQQWFKFTPRNSKPSFRLFCFHYAGTGASIFSSWSEKFPSEVEIIPIQLPGRENRLQETPFTRLKPLIQTLTPLLKEYLDVPFAFFGHSMGALISFEVARELRKQNCPIPDFLFVSAYRAPQIPDLNLPIYKLPDAKFIEAVSDYGGIPEDKLHNSEFINLFSPTMRADFEVLQTYFYSKEEPLESCIYAFGGLEDSKVSRQELAAWKKQAKTHFKLKMLAGDHFFLREAEDRVIDTITEIIQRLTVLPLSKTS